MKDIWIERFYHYIIYCLPDLQAFRVFNTYMGDHIRTVILSAIVKEIKRGQLLGLVKESGDVLLSGLKKLEVYYYFYYCSTCHIVLWFTDSILRITDFCL